MKKITLSLILFVTMGFGAHATELVGKIAQAKIENKSAVKYEPCKTQSNTSEINDCAAIEFKQLDEKLQRHVSQVFSRYPKERKDDIDWPKIRKLFMQEQRGWLQYRDSKCAIAAELEAGSNKGATYFSCLTEETEQRIKLISDSESDIRGSKK